MLTKQIENVSEFSVTVRVLGNCYTEFFFVALETIL